VADLAGEVAEGQLKKNLSGIQVPKTAFCRQ
jgi:hypothetical protein